LPKLESREPVFDVRLHFAMNLIEPYLSDKKKAPELLRKLDRQAVDYNAELQKLQKKLGTVADLFVKGAEIDRKYLEETLLVLSEYVDASKLSKSAGEQKQILSLMARCALPATLPSLLWLSGGSAGATIGAFAALSEKEKSEIFLGLVEKGIIPLPNKGKMKTKI
jgi:hypothetical protein